MYAGGHSKLLSSVKLFHSFGLLLPAFLIIYGTLIQSGYINSPHLIDNVGFLLFSLWWVVISVINYLFPIRSTLDSALRLIAFHLLAGSYLIFISGVASLVAVFWLILSLGSYIYFSKRGLIYSVLSLIFFVSFDIILWGNVNYTIAINDLLTLSVLIVTIFIVYYAFRSSETSKKELAASKAQEALQRDRVITIVNNLADAVISTDIDGVIKVYNASCMSLLDTNVSLIGKHIDDALPLVDKEGKEYSLFKELQNAKTVGKHDDIYFVVSEDERMRLEITYSPIRSSFSRSKKAETHDGYIVIMRDVTKAKSLEEERDEFISVISHELRTPITIVEGTISNAQVMMDHPDVTTKMLKDSMETAHEQILFLAGMVNDLSTLSRAERGVGDNTEDIDVNALAHELHKKYQADAKAKKLHLNLDISTKLGKVNVSKLYLEELLQNFITNSIKYTKEGSVTIQIKQKNDVITFIVKDTGIGISKSDQQKVFDKFYRSEDYRTRETSGTGLGLYVSAKLAHKMGTKIHLTSRLNHGSSFSFNLPVTK